LIVLFFIPALWQDRSANPTLFPQNLGDGCDPLPFSLIQVVETVLKRDPKTHLSRQCAWASAPRQEDEHGQQEESERDHEVCGATFMHNVRGQKV
jgi:hypothetical protein